MRTTLMVRVWTWLWSTKRRSTLYCAKHMAWKRLQVKCSKNTTRAIRTILPDTCKTLPLQRMSLVTTHLPRSHPHQETSVLWPSTISMRIRQDRITTPLEHHLPWKCQISINPCTRALCSRLTLIVIKRATSTHSPRSSLPTKRSGRPISLLHITITNHRSSRGKLAQCMTSTSKDKLAQLTR